MPALASAIAPFVNEDGLLWSKAQAGLEDVFIQLTGRALREEGGP